MGVTIATTRAALNTSTGTQDITTSDLGGLTPTGVILVVTSALTDGTVANTFRLSIGAASGATERWCATGRSEHGASSSDCDTRSQTDQVISLHSPTGLSQVMQADFDSFIADGVRIDIGVADSAFLCEAWFVAGTDTESHAGVFTPHGTVSSATNITDPGFQPDWVFCVTQAQAFDDNNDTNQYVTIGGAVRDGSDTQRCYGLHDENGKATVDVNGQFSELYATGRIGSTASFKWGGEIDDFDSSGFSCITRLDSPNLGDQVGYLAVSLGGVVGFDLGTYDTPTSTGDDTLTTGHTPQSVFMVGTQFTAVDTAKTDDTVSTVGIGMVTATAEYFMSISEEDAASTTNNQSLSENRAIKLPDDDGTTGIEADFSAMVATGITFNYTAVKGTATKFWYFSVEEESSGTSVPIFYHHRTQQGLA